MRTTRISVAALAVVVLLSACDRDTPAPPQPQHIRERQPLVFRPVLEITPPGSCEAAAADPAREARLPGTDGICYTLGPAPLTATTYGARLVADPPGPSSDPLVEVTLTTPDMTRFNALARACFDGTAACPTRAIAIVFGGTVQSAPTVQEPSFEGTLHIAGVPADMQELIREMDG